MQLEVSKTRQQFPLSTKKVLKKTLANTLLVTLLFLTVYCVMVIGLVSRYKISEWLVSSSLFVFGFIFFFIGIVYFYQRWYYAVYFYDLAADYIVIRKGAITPQEITIPYERIQDVYVDQDILDRIFGLYDVHLSSATVSSGIAAHIDGLEKSEADGLKHALLKIINERISRKRVSTSL
ncbi:MAG: PH domain-containing protein [Verrucomicrobiae bacterium]|nr:PH domain-containing protein [Verrucomicrobiae bacterium]